jgi:hypothetical protein
MQVTSFNIVTRLQVKQMKKQVQLMEEVNMGLSNLYENGTRNILTTNKVAGM